MAIEALGSTVGQGVKEQGRTLVLPTLDLAAMWRAILAALRQQEQHLLLYAPMFLIAGNWTYFQLHDEPSLLLNFILFALSCSLMLMRRRNTMLLVAGLILLGFCATKFREESVATPMLRGPVNGVIAGGYIADVNTRAKGAKELVIANIGHSRRRSAAPHSHLCNGSRRFADWRLHHLRSLSFTAATPCGTWWL